MPRPPPQKKWTPMSLRKDHYGIQVCQNKGGVDSRKTKTENEALGGRGSGRRPWGLPHTWGSGSGGQGRHPLARPPTHALAFLHPLIVSQGYLTLHSPSSITALPVHSPLLHPHPYHPPTSACPASVALCFLQNLENVAVGRLPELGVRPPSRRDSSASARGTRSPRGHLRARLSASTPPPAP